MFASCSYDKTVKVWDLRSSMPLYTLQKEEKLFGLDWVEDLLACGGEDSKLSLHLP